MLSALHSPLGFIASVPVMITDHVLNILVRTIEVMQHRSGSTRGTRTSEPRAKRAPRVAWRGRNRSPAHARMVAALIAEILRHAPED